MGVLEKLMFWKREETPEQVDGFTVDGCFALPDAEQVPGAEGLTGGLATGAEQLRSTDLPLADVQPDPAAVEPPAEHG